MDKKTIMRKAISEALEALLEEADSLQDISVQDILEQCGLSRPTFYRYFSDKYDVVNWSYTYYVEELSGLYDLPADSSDVAFSQNFVRFFYDKRHFFCKVMDYVGQNSFYEHYFSCLVRWYTTMRFHTPREVDSLPVEERYMLVCSAAGTVQILREWLAGGCKEPPEEILPIIIRSVPEGVSRYIA